MLRTLRCHPLVAGATEVLADAARYIAVMAILMILVGQLVRLLGAAMRALMRSSVPGERDSSPTRC